MAEHTGFQKLVAEAKKHVTEISPQDAASKLNSGDAVVVDVRDKDEWDEGHIPGATHMSRGTIELDIEEKIPDPDAIIICHCGGGGRSALAAENLQKMGYKNVRSMAGGLKAWKAAGLPTTKESNALNVVRGARAPRPQCCAPRATHMVDRVFVDARKAAGGACAHRTFASGP